MRFQHFWENILFSAYFIVIPTLVVDLMIAGYTLYTKGGLPGPETCAVYFGALIVGWFALAAIMSLDWDSAMLTERRHRL